MFTALPAPELPLVKVTLCDHASGVTFRLMVVVGFAEPKLLDIAEAPADTPWFTPPNAAVEVPAVPSPFEALAKPIPLPQLVVSRQPIALDAAKPESVDATVLSENETAVAAPPRVNAVELASEAPAFCAIALEPASATRPPKFVALAEAVATP